MGLEIIIPRQDTSTQKLLLEYLHKVEKILGLTTTNVIDSIGGNGQTVVACLTLRRLSHDTDNALDDVIDIGEVTTTVAIVVNLDGIALQQLIGKTEIGHVGTTGRTIDSEEAKPRGGDIVELGVAVGKELIALLGSGIKGDRIVNTVVGGERYLLVASIDAAGRGIDEVLNRIVTTSLKDIVEAKDVALDISIRVLDAITDTSLGCKVDNNVEVILSKEAVDKVAVGDGALNELIVGR